jgi:hypothetical protein
MSYFIFDHIFNRSSDIHVEIMSYIDGKYFDKENIDAFLEYSCKIGNMYLVKYIKNTYGISNIYKQISTTIYYGHINILKYLYNECDTLDNLSEISTSNKVELMRFGWNCVSDSDDSDDSDS